MSDIYGLARDIGVDMPKFKDMIITLRPFQHSMLERRLEVLGYRLRGERKSSIDKFLCTYSDGTYSYLPSYPIRKVTPVNFKDIVGSQITTVDFVKGFAFGFIVCLILMFIF